MFIYLKITQNITRACAKTKKKKNKQKDQMTNTVNCLQHAERVITII